VVCVLAQVLLDLGLEVVVLEGEHAAVGLAFTSQLLGLGLEGLRWTCMVDDDNLARPEQLLRDDEVADRGDGAAAGVADDVRVALGQAELLGRVDARVHAGDDGYLSAQQSVIQSCRNH
jgi:hypothetical protein